MKISRWEIAVLVAAAVFTAFLAGWFFGSRGGGSAARGESAYEVTVAGEASAVPAPATPAPPKNPAPGLLEGERININTAPAADLERLPGIGQSRAEDIVAWREAHGPFAIPEALTDVPGIGEKTLQGLLDYITTGET